MAQCFYRPSLYNELIELENKMKTAILKTTVFAASVAVAALFINPAMANNETGDSGFTSERYTAIKEKYAARLEQIKREGQALSDKAPSPTAVEAGINIDFDVSWETTSMKFDIPEIKILTREFKLHLPQFRMKRHSINWDNPETFWAVTKTAPYPCFKGLKMYTCWIKTKVPQIKMVRREAKFDLPEVFWEVTSFKMDIPEFYSKRVKWKLDLPQFKAKDVKVEIGKHKAAAERLAVKAKALGNEQKAEFYAVAVNDLKSKRSTVSTQFDTAEKMMSEAIQKIKAAGANPEALTVNGAIQNLVVELAKLRTKRAEILAMIDAKIKEMTQTTA